MKETTKDEVKIIEKSDEKIEKPGKVEENGSKSPNKTESVPVAAKSPEGETPMETDQTDTKEPATVDEKPADIPKTTSN